jgi:hypothetical protein
MKAFTLHIGGQRIALGDTVHRAALALQQHKRDGLLDGVTWWTECVITPVPVPRYDVSDWIGERELQHA